MPASYDLAAPAAAELAEIVRAPAAAAGLAFDADPKTGERLDERLLKEADRPDMLPLVQLALSRLWDARVTHGADTLLPFAAYEKLGGVKGIVEEAGETALASLGETERAKLGPLSAASPRPRAAARSPPARPRSPRPRRTRLRES